MSRTSPRGQSARRRFEPARLLLGLSLLVLAPLYALRAVDGIAVPWWLLLGGLPVALLAAAVVALVTYAVRRPRVGEPAGD
ncbi:hypothetical protein GCM10009716_31700 [Streptomyces sodiiphilus]|uniref:DUF3311 domain-containing protein n=1 Tax=Streptomyces sodiiphilus TaxID=226217 RepID=A0ABP5AUR1_9ACTN